MAVIYGAKLVFNYVDELYPFIAFSPPRHFIINLFLKFNYDKFNYNSIFSLFFSLLFHIYLFVYL